MEKLKPVYRYRLRLLLTGPRFYAPRSFNDYLEKRAYIRRTGRTDEDNRQIEYELTERGRAALQTEAGEA